MHPDLEQDWQIPGLNQTMARHKQGSNKMGEVGACEYSCFRFFYSIFILQVLQEDGKSSTASCISLELNPKKDKQNGIIQNIKLN